jgi:hypothetical protein
MKTLVFLLAISISGISLADDKVAELVKVYCFSADLQAGFKDGDALFYCKQLGKRGDKKKSLELVTDRDSAEVLAHYMGVEEYQERGEAAYLNYGIAWTPTQDKTRETAIIKVGTFAKAFSGSGINAQAAMSIVRQTEEWIRENRGTIMEKAKKK